MLLNKKMAIIFSATLGFVSIDTFAVAGETQTLALSTDVPVVCTIESSAPTFAPNLVAGESDTTMATITEICNDMDGYTVTFSSANSGKLQNSDVSSEQKDYTITYNDINDKKLNANRSTSYSSGTESNVVSLIMNLDANSGVLAAGTWSDTITATIAVID